LVIVDVTYILAQLTKPKNLYLVMKYFLILLLVAFTLNLSAQNKKNLAGDDGYAVIKGHIENSQSNFWEYATIGYLGYPNVSVSVDRNGDFLARVKLQGTHTDIMLDLGRGIMFYLKKNDTITVKWDAKNITNSFNISAARHERDNDIKTAMALFDFSFSSTDELYAVLYNKSAADSVKFSKVNELYNRSIEIVKAGNCTADANFKLATDLYFKYSSFLLRDGLIRKYHLATENQSPGFNRSDYRLELESYFKASSEYRDFIYDYVRTYEPFVAWGPTNDPSRVVSNVAEINCYAGMMAFHLYEIRDWYLTRMIMYHFGKQSFAEATEAYHKFLPEIKGSYYADTLKKFYTGISTLKPGVSAPGFILKNHKGQTVTLASFKGKVVYLDFWGTRCGPCIQAIKNEVPALHLKYKDKNIVFINICVDANEAEWKANLKKLNLQGVNLIAEGWTKNPVCKAYNVSSIPHYCIIGTSGKIVNASSPGPEQRFDLSKQIDQLLQ
jgi:peroxiredoxin